MTAVYRSTVFIVIGRHAPLMKVPPRPRPRTGQPADDFGPRFKDVARSVRKSLRSWFGVIRMTTKRAKRWLASLTRLFARVDQFARQEKILKSQQEAGGRAI